MTHNLQIAVGILQVAEEIVGKKEPVIIDSNIYKHDFFWGEDKTEEQIHAREAHDIHTIRGSKNHPITLQQVTDAFVAMQDQFNHVSEDRSYYYERVEFDEADNMYVIVWSS